MEPQPKKLAYLWCLMRWRHRCNTNYSSPMQSIDQWNEAITRHAEPNILLQFWTNFRSQHNIEKQVGQGSEGWLHNWPHLQKLGLKIEYGHHASNFPERIWSIWEIPQTICPFTHPTQHRSSSLQYKSYTYNKKMMEQSYSPREMSGNTNSCS